MTESVYVGPCNQCGAVHGGWEACPPDRQNANDAMQEDVAELLRLLGLGDHARPVAPHVVMRNEIIPALRARLASDAGGRGEEERHPDSERLDWLERALWDEGVCGNGIALFPSTRVMQGTRHINIMDVGDEDGSSLGEELADGLTLREAIDAARAREEGTDHAR